jgi:hypothetical protein
MVTLNISLSELSAIENTDKRSAVYSQILTEIRDSLTEKLEEAEEDNFSDSDFDRFLETSMAHGLGPISYEQMAQAEKYKAGFLEWIQVRLDQAEFLLSHDYMDEFTDKEADDLEEAIGEWAWEAVDDIGDNSTHSILANFS